MKQKWAGYRQGFIVFIMITLLLGASGCMMMKSYQQVMAEKRAKYRNIDLSRLISSQEVQDDLHNLITTLEAVHPHPYTVFSRNTFQDNLEKLTQSLVGSAKTTPTQTANSSSQANSSSKKMTLTIRELYLKLAPLMVALEQDYTCLPFPQEAFRAFQLRNGKLFPFEVNLVGEKLIVKTNYSPKPIAPGAEIESINGVPAGEIITTLLKYCEGSTLSLRNQRLARNFQGLLWLVYNFQEPYTISIDTRWIPVSGVTSTEIQSFQRRHSPNAEPPSGIDYQHLGEAVGLLAIRNFHEEKFTVKLKNAFAEMTRNQIRDLILDLRTISGEGSLQVEQLIEYLCNQPYITISGMEQKRSLEYDQQIESVYYWWAKPILRLHPATKDYYQTPIGQIALLTMAPRNPKPLKSRFKGKVYVLIGPNTNSSGTELASVIKDYRLGMLIGQITGAAANEYGNPYEFVLPHSNLWVSAATSYSIRPSGDKSMGGIVPDIEVTFNPDELDSNLDPASLDSSDQDPVLETTQKIIALNRKQK